MYDVAKESTMTGTEETATEPTEQQILEMVIGKAADYLGDVRDAIDATPAGEHNRPAMLTLKVQLAQAAATWALAMKTVAGVELDDDDDDEQLDDVDKATIVLLDKRVADLEAYITEAGDLIDVRGELEQTKRELEGAHRRAAELSTLLEAERDRTHSGEGRIAELEKQAKLDAAELDSRGFRIDALEQAAAAAGVDVDVVGTDADPLPSPATSTVVRTPRTRKGGGK